MKKETKENLEGLRDWLLDYGTYFIIGILIVLVYFYYKKYNDTLEAFNAFRSACNCFVGIP